MNAIVSLSDGSLAFCLDNWDSAVLPMFCNCFGMASCCRYHDTAPMQFTAKGQFTTLVRNTTMLCRRKLCRQSVLLKCYDSPLTQFTDKGRFTALVCSTIMLSRRKHRHRTVASPALLCKRGHRRAAFDSLHATPKGQLHMPGLDLHRHTALLPPPQRLHRSLQQRLAPLPQ